MTHARFVAWHDLPEHELTRGRKLRFALMLAHSPRGLLLVFNTWRRVWELPGGLIDPGETPRIAAERELFEETGCRGQAHRCLGLVEVHDGQTHLGAVFDCELREVDVHFRSDETDGIDFWTTSRWPEPLGATDAAILTRHALSRQG